MKYALLIAPLALLALATGCTNVEQRVRKVPSFSFETWSHSDRYGLFTDKVTISGAKWTLNPDGSATLTVEQFDGEAAWAGAVGPHDTMTKLSINFPPTSAQALKLRSGVTPNVSEGVR